MKFKKVLLTLPLFLFLFGSVSFAKVPVNAENFDYDWYFSQHPDVLAATDGDHAATWSFYTTMGESSGWLGRPTLNYMITTFPSETEVYTKMYSVVDQQITLGMSQREKALKMHDWLCSNVDYDYNFQRSSYGITGAILNGASVCQGYAESFDIFMQLCGIDCEVVSGVADNGSGSGGHAWNKVFIDGAYSYVDVTWDDFTKDYNYIAHDCFMVSETEMNRIHDGCVYLFYNGQPSGYVKR